MDGFLWAFSSAILVMLIVYFLPLGLAKKGKFLLVGISFLLALAGIVASASFSFLITVLILVVLVLFVTYLLDQRLGKFFYNIDGSTDAAEDEDFFMHADVQTAAGHESVYQRKNKAAVELVNLLKDDTQATTLEEITEPDTVGISENERKQSEGEKEIQDSQADDEDVTFLLNRTMPMEEDNTKNPEEQKHEDPAYLAEIEELLEDDLTSQQSIDLSKPSHNTAIVTENDHEIPLISFEDIPLKKNSEEDTKPARNIEEFDEMPILPFLEKEEKQ